MHTPAEKYTFDQSMLLSVQAQSTHLGNLQLCAPVTQRNLMLAIFISDDLVRGNTLFFFLFFFIKHITRKHYFTA